MFDLKGKTAVVTGGSGVLCTPLCEDLAACGVRVAVLGRREAKAEQRAQRIRDKGGTAIGLGVDVLRTGALEKARERIITEYGTLDILINGAGGNKADATTSDDRDFFDIPEEALKWVFDLNFLGTVKATQVFGKIFADKGTGTIINISSMTAFTPLTRTVAYSGAKAAVSNFTQWMAVHFSRNYSQNIRVNAIAPGFFLTEQNRYLLIDEQTGEPTDRGSKIIESTPMGRYGRPEELIGIVRFLCSDAASFVTGTVIPIDGGFSAYSGV